MSETPLTIDQELGTSPAPDPAPRPGPPAAEHLFGWLRRPTGPGQVEEYQGHPLNPDGSPAWARILRGMTGLAGDLGLAVVDIAMGSLQLFTGRRRPPAGDGEAGP